MKTFTKLLQTELKKRKYLSVNNVMELCFEYNHLYDTARRKLEPDITPFSEKVEENHRIKGWEYLEEKDIAETLKEIKSDTLKEKIQNPLFNMPINLN